MLNLCDWPHLRRCIAKRAAQRALHDRSLFLPEAYLVGAPLALLAGIKLRIMSRRSLNVYQSEHRVAAFFEGRWRSFMSAVLANSRSVARQLELDGVRAERLGLIYNGLNGEARPPNGRARSRHALGVGEATLVFVIVANLIPYKRHLDLIEASGRVTDQLPADWRLLVVGRDDGVVAAAQPQPYRSALPTRSRSWDRGTMCRTC